MKSGKDILYYWMEEFPIEELVSEEAKEIVERYRQGETDSMECSQELWEECKEDIEHWFKQNQVLNSL